MPPCTYQGLTQSVYASLIKVIQCNNKRDNRETNEPLAYGYARLTPVSSALNIFDSTSPFFTNT